MSYKLFPQPVEIVNVTSSTTLSAHENEQIVLIAGASITVTLPSIASNSIGAGVRYQLKVTDSNFLTVAPSGQETIDGDTSYTTAGAQESLTVVCDGSNWRLI